MEILLLCKALVLGVVEGLTEFLPVSSTGHLILVGALLDFNDDKGKVFEIVIQAGAILAVCFEYRARIAATFRGLLDDRIARRLTLNLAIAFMPAAVVGLAFGKAIKAALFKPVPVALAFILGGVVILVAERWYRKQGAVAHIDSVDDLDWKDALKLGLAQTLAVMFPGTSRSGATIIGGLFFGLSRKCATEFSFFLAIPTLFAATGYELYKERALLSAADLPLFGTGFVAAFISAFFVVRWLIRYVSTHDFSLFAWYRIAFGIVVLATAFSGIVEWTAN